MKRAFVALLLFGCTASADPLLTVGLRTDYSPGMQFQEVRTEVFLDEEAQPPVMEPSELGVDRETALVPALRTAQIEGLRLSESYVVRVSLVQDDALVASQERRLTVSEPNHGLAFVITQACTGVVCPRGEVCVGRQGCVPEAEVCFDANGDDCTTEPECADSADCGDALWCQRADCRSGLCLYPTNSDVCDGDCIPSGFDAYCDDGEVNTPLITSPARGEMMGSPGVDDRPGYGGRPKLTWTPDSSAVRFEYEVRRCVPSGDETCAERSLVVTGESALAYVTVPEAQALPFGQYVWRVHGCDDEECHEWSEESSFWVAERTDIDGDDFAEHFIGAPEDMQPDDRLGSVHIDRGTGAVPDIMLEGAGGYGAAIDAGDLSGDGRAELIVGAPQFDNGTSKQGRVFVHVDWRGGEDFLSRPEFSAPVPMVNGHFGEAVTWLADVTFDGNGDLAVGEPGGRAADGGRGHGQVHVYSDVLEDGHPVYVTIAPPNSVSGRFGAALEGCDLTGDGRTDLIVGEPHGGRDGQGAVHIYDDLTTAEPTPIETLTVVDVSEFGAVLRCIPDLNADGHSELLIGAPGDEGAAFVLFGGRWQLGAPRLVQLDLGRGTHLGRALAAFPTQGLPVEELVVGGDDGLQFLSAADWSIEFREPAWEFVNAPMVMSRDTDEAVTCLASTGHHVGNDVLLVGTAANTLVQRFDARPEEIHTIDAGFVESYGAVCR